MEGKATGKSAAFLSANGANVVFAGFFRLCAEFCCLCKGKDNGNYFRVFGNKVLRKLWKVFTKTSGKNFKKISVKCAFKKGENRCASKKIRCYFPLSSSSFSRRAASTFAHRMMRRTMDLETLSTLGVPNFLCRLPCKDKTPLRVFDQVAPDFFRNFLISSHVSLSEIGKETSSGFRFFAAVFVAVFVAAD